MNSDHFNKSKFLELLNKSERLYQEGTSLWDVDKVKAKQLNRYLCLICDGIFWNSREKYLKIIKSFINKNIDIDQFIEQFGQLRSANFKAEALGVLSKASEIDLQLNPQSIGFAKMIGSIYTSIDLLNPDVDLDMNLNNPDLIVYGMSHEFFRLDLKDNFFPRIVRYCKES